MLMAEIAEVLNYALNFDGHW